jgi:integrase
VRLPDPITEPDAFMRKLAHLQRADIRQAAARAGTFNDAVRLYRKAPDFTDRSDNTRKLYDTYLDRLAAIFGGAPLTDITAADVQRYVMDEHADTRGAANMMLKVLHIVFKWAGKRREGLRDPTLGIEEFDGGEHSPWPDHILSAALASDDALFRAAVALHLYTGQRTGDVCRMTWNTLTADGRIPVVQQKTKSDLLIPIHPALQQELGTGRRRTLTILGNREGKPLKPAAFRGWVNAFAEKHGVHLVPHGLRKNAVIGLLEATCSTAEVSAITGQSLQMVEHYAKQRNQGRLAQVAMLKWGQHGTGTGKLSATSKTAAGNR